MDHLIESHAFGAVWLSGRRVPSTGRRRAQPSGFGKTMYSRWSWASSPKRWGAGLEPVKGQVSWKDVIAAVKGRASSSWP